MTIVKRQEKGYNNVYTKTKTRNINPIKQHTSKYTQSFIIQISRMCDMKIENFYLQHQNKPEVNLYKQSIQMCNINLYYNPINNINYQPLEGA